MIVKTKSERFKRLLSHGYFPPELPPCFVSDGLAKYRKVLWSTILKIPALKNGDPAYYRFKASHSTFYFPRFGKDDRRHSVPNPISHLLLSRVLADNYIKLRDKARCSKLSLSPPVFDWSGSRAIMRSNVDLRDAFRVNLSAKREQYVEADIRAYFHSIYTHAIPWAIYGKEFAKKNQGFSHYGNLIDLLCRNSQDGQTIGLPVGPDTSRLIAEVIASAIDEHIQVRLQVGAQDASRYVDDYTLSSPNSTDGEELLSTIRQSAAIFELELSSEKSAIFPTSHRHNSGWQQEVRACIPKVSLFVPETKSDDLLRFFYSLGRICAAHPDVNVEKFGVQNARSVLVRSEDWSLVQSHLINAYRRNASLVSLLAEICILRFQSDKEMQTDVLKEFIENRIPVLARSNRTGEIIWLLFLAMRLNIIISSEKIGIVSSIENPFIAVLVLRMETLGNIEGYISRALWDQSLTELGLRSPMWLYAYEAITTGLCSEADKSLIDLHPYFGILKAKKIEFIDMSRGFTSIRATLKSLRNENLRLLRVREAIEDENLEELNKFDDQTDILDHEDDTERREIMFNDDNLY